MLLTSTGKAPIACTASVWKGTPWSRAIRLIAATGWTVPISLFAAITETRMVLSVIASSTAPGSTRPNSSTGR